MKYVFQRSKIWEAGNPIDASSASVRIKVPDGSPEARARQKLPATGMGRVWILIAVEESRLPGGRMSYDPVERALHQVVNDRSQLSAPRQAQSVA